MQTPGGSQRAPLPAAPLPAATPSLAPRKDSAASRIDPKQIPRPIYNHECVKYFTRSGACPPPANSSFSVIDEGNCSPRFLR